ncbi:Sec-independent protein translocase subunit TatC, partial [Pseudomonas syringae]|nr:Sec-independent protein translocase subunit TatC [Pseudomonas syringae]
CSSMIKKRGEHPDDQAQDTDKPDQPPATTP